MNKVFMKLTQLDGTPAIMDVSLVFSIFGRQYHNHGIDGPALGSYVTLTWPPGSQDTKAFLVAESPEKVFEIMQKEVALKDPKIDLSY